LYPERESAKMGVMQPRTRSFTSGWTTGLTALGVLALVTGCAQGVEPGGEQLGGSNQNTVDASTGGGGGGLPDGGSLGGFPDADPFRPDAGGGFDFGDDAAPPPPDDPDVEQIVITANSSIAVSPGSFAGCILRQEDETVFHRQNNYFRVFTPSDFGITGDFTVEVVHFGVARAAGIGGNQPVAIAVGHQASGGEPDPGNVVVFASGTLNIADRETTSDQSAYLNIRLNVDAEERVVPAGRHLYVELALPDGRDQGGEGVHNVFDVGLNFENETAPSFFSSPECDGIDLTTFEDAFGAGSGRWVVAVTGTHEP
jgi:hypothetical protein